MARPKVNPECEQDRAYDLWDTWHKYHYVMFPQQQAIYRHLAKWLANNTILEAGCGNGVGSALLERAAWKVHGVGFVATDKLKRNVEFASGLYPWIKFAVWDVTQPWADNKFEVVVAVEVLEHVADPQTALRNLIAAAKEEVWLSTPNGRFKPRPPDNPYHCAEFTPAEVLEMVERVVSKAKVEVMGWEHFEPVGLDTDIDPLVYRIIL